MLQPRPHQAAEIPLLLQGHRALWWKPGVGKTLPLVLAGQQRGGPQLWITLADLRAQAARVIAANRSDNPRVQVLRTGRDVVQPAADVVVVSYDLIRVAEIWRQLFARAWGSIVCDEAHALKATTALRTRAVYGARPESPGALYHRTSHVWLATGTPVLNDPMDLYPHVSRLWPHELPDPDTKAGWMDYHCTTRPGQYGPLVTGARRPQELKALLHRVGSMRELDLEARLDVDHVVLDVTDEARAEIEREVDADTWAEIEALFADMDGGAARERMQDEARLLPLVTARRVLGLAKARPTATLAAGELDGGLSQIIVWGHHTAALQHVTNLLHKYGAALLNGSTPKGEREKILADFVAGRIRALVANIGVGGTGIDGLQCSHRCLLMEPDWTPARNAQAIARQYRTGQQHPVHASFLAVARSPDEIIARVLARKARTISETTGRQ